MQTRQINSLIRKFENNEFSNLHNNYDKKNINYDHQISKISKFNDIYDSSGTLYEGDSNKHSNEKFKIRQNGKISHELIQKFQQNNESNIKKYSLNKEKIIFSDYKESAETLIGQSSDNLNDKSKSSLTSIPGELDHSLSLYDSRELNNKILENTSYSLSYIDKIDDIENILEEKENQIDDNIKYEDIECNDSINQNYDEDDISKNLPENDSEKNNENINEEINNDNDKSGKYYHMFDINKLIKNIIKVDVISNNQNHINDINENENYITNKENLIDVNSLSISIKNENTKKETEVCKVDEIDEEKNEISNKELKLESNSEINKKSLKSKIENEDKIEDENNIEKEDVEQNNKNDNMNHTIQENKSTIEVEKYNNVEKIDRYDEKTKQYYKEKIIDKRFKLTYVLARGGCGEIRATEDLLVCKIIPRAKKPKVDKNSSTYQYYLDYELDLLKEATISSLLIHPNILYMKYMVRTANYFYLISEKIDGEDLCDYIIKKGRLLEKKAKEIIYEVIIALQYLHSNHIVHRDVKCENIMREKGTGRIVLLDFGSACFYTSFSSQINEFCGSPVYQAPEVILSQPYWGPELDVWGLGVVLYVLTTGRLPFDPSKPDITNNSMVDLMYSGPEYPEYLSYECKMLISRMLCFDPNQRAKLQDVLKHPWLRSYVQYKKLKEFKFNDNGQENINTFKRLNSNNSLSLKPSNSRSSIVQSIKNIKIGNLITKTKGLFTSNSVNKINQRYIGIQKEHLNLNSPFSSNSATYINSIFNKSSYNDSGNVISQMFAYAVSREDETKENKIKLLKKVMNNQV
ncbi:kinase-like protein [Anaeromyces robustus]|uniref:Kinase-like protein n=1 Tax=Anaeromyces robustus TaxID=1754192 RepID=A0A1Y1X660_9FUNG|nr:kinase-like protein [Anaeromyces robustus]|eukprot:ORX81155.1 kinase-like protein [Anaeromyces robustus]